MPGDAPWPRAGMCQCRVRGAPEGLGQAPVSCPTDEIATPGAGHIRAVHERPGTRLPVARERAGVNADVLSPGTFVDEISGNAAVNGIPATVGPLPGATTG